MFEAIPLSLFILGKNRSHLKPIQVNVFLSWKYNTLYKEEKNTVFTQNTQYILFNLTYSYFFVLVCFYVIYMRVGNYILEGDPFKEPSSLK